MARRHAGHLAAPHRRRRQRPIVLNPSAATSLKHLDLAAGANAGPLSKARAVFAVDDLHRRKVGDAGDARPAQHRYGVAWAPPPPPPPPTKEWVGQRQGREHAATLRAPGGRVEPSRGRSVEIGDAEEGTEGRRCRPAAPSARGGGAPRCIPRPQGRVISAANGNADHQSNRPMLPILTHKPPKIPLLASRRASCNLTFK